MSSREIVLVMQEEARTKEQVHASLYQEFVAQWTPEMMPACDVGMTLLLDLATASPIAYEMARKQNFANLTHPLFTQLPKWKAFAKHYSLCPNCKEK